MKKLLIGAALLLTTTAAFGAETLKANVGHMCCGACKAAAQAGVKKLDFVQDAAIDGTTMTVTAKDGKAIDLIALTDAMNKSGFPAREIMLSGPVTFTVGHLCCPNCTNDLKAKLGDIRSEVLDKTDVKIDQTTKTVVLKPVAGKTMNLVVLLNQMNRAGFSTVKATGGFTGATASAPKAHGTVATR